MNATPTNQRDVDILEDLTIDSYVITTVLNR
jgi:hypothetical protein